MSSEPNLPLPPGTKVPDHIAVVLDGNRRWARAKGLSTLEGHKAGFEAGLKIARASRSWGVHTFTVWGFSTENWNRSEQEISYLQKLFWRMVQTVEKEAAKDDIRFVHLGRKDRLPASLVKYIKKVEDKTRNNSSHIFNVALDYGGHDEILRAVRKIIEDKISPKDINEDLFASYLDTGDQPYPNVDLFIRTSGEQRTSGLLPWQSHYAEFYWETDHLPDFTPAKLRDAILDYSRRRRRFGGDDEVEHFAFQPEVVAHLELAWARLANVPEGKRLREYAMEHIKQQYGISKQLAFEAAKYLTQAFFAEREKNWDQAKMTLRKFYQLIKDEVKLAFEPEIVASLEVRMRREMENGGAEDAAKELYAEVYRISLFQAAKAAHLRVLAAAEIRLAQAGLGEEHWQRAEDYLQKFYWALKERVA